jgi:hypothetical protein
LEKRAVWEDMSTGLPRARWMADTNPERYAQFFTCFSVLS